MAKQVITQLLDDYSGGPADQTITFAFDGINYSIDLSEKNAAKFRDTMMPWVETATRTGRSTSSGVRYKPSVSKQSLLEIREENTRIRQWAASNGYQVNARGRVPVNVVQAYESKTPNPTWVAVQRAKEIAASKPSKAASNGSKTTAPRQQRRGRTATAVRFQGGSGRA